MRDNPVMALVMRARTGDERAWDALVERYTPLIWSLCRRHGLDAAGAAARHAPDAENIPDEQAKTIEQELLVAERHAALREAFAHLPPCCQQLIALLIEAPAIPHAEISARLGIPVGSIGPNRRRCLDKLRHHPAIAALINADSPR